MGIFFNRFNSQVSIIGRTDNFKYNNKLMVLVKLVTNDHTKNTIILY